MLWRAGRGFVVRDLPWTVEKLRAIPPFEFENWVVIALGGRGVAASRQSAAIWNRKGKVCGGLPTRRYGASPRKEQEANSA